MKSNFTAMLLGIHVSKTSTILDKKNTVKDLSEAIVRDADALGLNAVQIFTYGPQKIVPNKMDYDAIKEATKDIDLTVHSAYATTGIWTVDEANKNSSDSKKKLDLFKLQLMSCMKVGAWGMVVHVGKQYSDVVAETMTLLKPLSKKTGVKVILEMVASKADADKTYETPEKMDNLTTQIGATEQWWGWCVDTAHIWAAGVDIKSYESMKDWLDRVTYKKKIVQFHLNGSSAIRGNGKDKHAIAFSHEDKIWYGIEPSKSGVRAIVEFALQNSVTIICEINRGLESEALKSINTIKSLAGL